jgi:hypothetical protein
MESAEIKELLEKYFEGETTVAEEKELARYFAGPVAPELEMYRSYFGFFAQEKEVSLPVKQLQQVRKLQYTFISAAAAILVLLGIGYYSFYGTESTGKSGVINDPQEAYQETQKALMMLSGHLNKGVESMQYLEKVEESKNRIFKKEIEETEE